MIFLVVMAGRVFEIAATDSEKVRHFETDIRPLLVRHCAECHDPEDREGGFVATTVAGLRRGGGSGATLVPGDLEASRLIQAVRYTGRLKMPPDGRLPQRVIDKLSQWVADGARMPEGATEAAATMVDAPTVERKGNTSHWSFQPIADRLAPEVNDPEWARMGIDRFVLAKLEASGLAPNPTADRRTLIRRVSFDLTGLPPEPTEVKRFVNDRSPRAYAALVDRLLASPQYGERWGRHWLDAARYADSNGGGFDYVYPSAYHFRDYVIRALNEDKPYDRFLVEQLAGDLLPVPESPDAYHEQLKATGLLTLAPKGLGEQDKVKAVMDVVDDEIDVVGRSIMGLTLACARCHDHKFDPITTEDYYSLAGIFRSVELVKDTDKNPSYWPERPLEHPRIRKRRLAWEKRKDANERAIAGLKARTEVALFGKDEVPPPVAHWGFDDGVGKGAILSNLKNGGPKPELREGMLGEAVAFAGKQDVVELTQSARSGLSFGKKTDFSVAFWIRAAAGYAPKTADSLVTARYGKGLWFIALRPGGYNGIYLRHYDGKASVDVRPAKNELPRLTDGGWHHVAFVSDRNGEATVYLDGEAAGSQSIATVSGRADYSAASSVAIGPAVNGFHGLIDDVAVWKVALKPKSVKAVYRAGAKDGKGIADITRPTGDLERFYSKEAREELAGLRREKRDIQAASIALPEMAMIAFDSAEPRDLRVHVAGDHRRLGEETKRGFPRSIAGPRQASPSGPSSGRLELAKWLVDPKHPLTARVMVNRVWQHHFGVGLAPTPDDFGWLGERPSHPELLDWLARRFIEDGWSLKALHRRILLSGTYQQSSAFNAASHAVDSGNRLLWRMNRRRLEAEPIRDAMLAVSGRLDRQMFGTFQTWKAKAFTVDDQNRKTARYDTNRRTVYLPVVRDAVYPMLTLFDFGDPNAVTPNRPSTTVPAQALFMMNNGFVRRQAEGLAERLLSGGFADTPARIAAAYQLCFSRAPSAAETGRAMRFIEGSPEEGKHAWTAFCHGLLSMNQFIHVD